MGVPVTVAMGNAYYVFFCAHGNSHAHAHAYSHGHAHDYVHGHVYYWQTCIQLAAVNGHLDAFSLLAARLEMDSDNNEWFQLGQV